MIVKGEIGSRGGSKVSVAIKESQEGPLCQNVLCGNVLHFDCIGVNIVPVTLYGSFPRYYHWGKLGEKYMSKISVLFFTTEGKSTITSK